MVSLKLSLSRPVSHIDMKEDWEELDRPPSSASVSHPSSSSSRSSLSNADAEDATINVRQSLEASAMKGQAKAELDDLRLLAISTNMTELSYSISDLQTRIFEIQELRHQSNTLRDSHTSSKGSTSIIDQALMMLDERLEAVHRGMKSVADALEPFISQTLHQPGHEGNECVQILRKHDALVADWEAVQDESEVLREELKEDKWLTVFRTVSEQADGMMSSLEKAVKRCQDFIWRVRRNVPAGDELFLSRSSTSSRDANAPLSIETFRGLLDSYEAKKKHYMPATSKVLSIIDKGVQDRVTKNGECLRRHAEAMQRWRNLRDRIQRTDAEMEKTRKFLLARDNDFGENASVTSERTSQSSKSPGLLTAPRIERRLSKQMDALSQSISPLRKLAKRISGVGGKGTSSSKQTEKGPACAAPQPTLRHRSSMFTVRSGSDDTAERSVHKHTQSFAPNSSAMNRRRSEGVVDDTVKARPQWNSSTKCEDEEPSRLIKPALSRRSSAANMRTTAPTPNPSVPPMPRRSQSRSSFASSRPWSPITMSNTSTTNASTTQSSISRPSSRAQSPFGTGPRSRPKTPSHIPTPVFWRGASLSSDGSDDRSLPDSSILQRLSPSESSKSGIDSISRAKTPLGAFVPPRPPSRSKIPVPKFQISSASRPASAMSDYLDRPDTSMSMSSSPFRPQTPESTLRGRVQQLAYYQDKTITPASSRRSSRLPPSSYRDTSGTPTQPRTSMSRPLSRAGSFTPQPDVYPRYVPVNSKDPLDAEVAAIANSIPHGLLIERVDPPLKATPKGNEEIKAQYSFSNHLARKTVVCRLLTMNRLGAQSKKVMCRVGGGWQELQLYLLNQQVGI